MIKKIREALARDKAKSIICEGEMTFCPSCGMAINLRMDEEAFCSYCGQRLDREHPIHMEIGAVD